MTQLYDICDASHILSCPGWMAVTLGDNGDEPLSTKNIFALSTLAIFLMATRSYSDSCSNIYCYKLLYYVTINC